jgi:hypothetical protein
MAPMANKGYTIWVNVHVSIFPCKLEIMILALEINLLKLEEVEPQPTSTNSSS